MRLRRPIKTLRNRPNAEVGNAPFPTPHGPGCVPLWSGSLYVKAATRGVGRWFLWAGFRNAPPSGIHSAWNLSESAYPRHGGGHLTPWGVVDAELRRTTQGERR